MRIFKPQLFKILHRFQIVDFGVQKYINDFIFNGLKHDILNKVIINGMTGSSWRFHKFLTLTVKVLNLDREIVKQPWLNLLILKLR